MAHRYSFGRKATLLIGSALCGAVVVGGVADAQVAAPVTQPADPADPGPAAQEAAAQATSPAAETAGVAPTGDIVVTGSRVVRDGYQAATPTTVVGVEDIQKAAPANIADFVNQLPQLSGSASTRSGNGNGSTGTNGLNTLNLRSLGATRTLVLLDGRRVVSSTPTGVVDINNLPSALVERVDIVTGGASAAYGSDAVAGVVNFVLNNKFEGVKGTVQSGITQRGDDANYNASLAAGSSFADGRGHALVSVEGQYQEGIDSLDAANRDWYTQSNLLTNPAYTATNGQPRRIVASNVNASTLARGGVITGSLIGTRASTLFANTQFGVGGTPAPFVRGAIVSDPLMVGGNQYSEGGAIALDSKLKRWSAFSRLSYDLTDTITASIEASHGYSRTENHAGYQRYAGNLTVSASNPFIDPTIRAQAAQAGVTQFRYGYSTLDLGRPYNVATRETTRLAAAVAGKIGTRFRWDAYYQYGRTDTESLLENTTNTARFALAIDAVRDGSGQIVCRSTLTNPTNGCVPLNIFGEGVASPEAIAYVKGVARQNLRLQQHVAAASINGEPFDTWAGPVSVALGGEYRKEQVSGTGDAISAVNGFYSGNFKGTNGSYDVKEGFGEVVVPLAKDVTLLHSLELNGAVRYTNYSTSGGVTTWKAGVTYEPVPDVRFRAVRSRDIRSANLSELFAAGQTSQQDITDPQRNLVLTRIQRITVGNVNLQPEKADTTSAGVVLTPSFLRQFSLSFDYYKIDLNDAITTLTQQEVVDRCYRGETSLCGFVVRNDAGVVTQVFQQPVNVAQQKVKGFDIESSFRQPLGDIVDGWSGTLTLRALASRIINRQTINNGIVTEAAGQNIGDAPKWRYFGTLSYDDEAVTLIGTVRGVSAGVYDNAWVSGVDIDNNRIAGATYFDLAGSLRVLRDPGRQWEMFFKIENLLDKDPPVTAGTGISSQQINALLYDVIGRNYRVGVRFRY